MARFLNPIVSKMGQPAEYYGNSGLGTITFVEGALVTLHHDGPRGAVLPVSIGLPWQSATKHLDLVLMTDPR